MKDLNFSRRWVPGLRCSGMWRSIVWYKTTNTLKGLASVFFMVDHDGGGSISFGDLPVHAKIIHRVIIQKTEIWILQLQFFCPYYPQWFNEPKHIITWLNSTEIRSVRLLSPRLHYNTLWYMRHQVAVGSASDWQQVMNDLALRECQ
jgi:hypothetical protein